MATQRKTPIRRRRHNKTNKSPKKYIFAGGPKPRRGRRPNTADAAGSGLSRSSRDRHSPLLAATTGLSPKTPPASTSIVRKSTRNSTLPVITQFNVGTPGSGYTAASTRIEFKKSERDELQETIALMNDGPYTISIPIPPQRHAILINIDTAAQKIRVCDWGGEKNRYFGDKQIANAKGELVKNKKYSPAWQLYSDLINGLEAKFPEFEVEYYPIDQQLFDAAHEKCERVNGGGCSEYVYSWIPKHLPGQAMIAHIR